MKELIHHNPVTLRGAQMLQWMNSMFLKASNILFATETERSPLLVQYVESFGNSDRSVHFRDKCNEMDVMCLIACYCKNITILRCTNVSLSLPFHAILRNNPNIQEIWVRNATCLVDDLMGNLSLHKLRLLSVYNMSSCVTGFPWSTSTYSNSLQCVEFIYTANYEKDTIALTQNCSNLRSFGCERITIEDESLISVLGRRLEIINLSVNDSHAVTDNAVCFIAQNLPCLRTLNIQKCKKLSSESLLHIAEHANQLEVLYCDVKDADEDTEWAVELFSQKCTRIGYLNINSDFVLCTTTCSLSLIKGCTALHTLVINTLNNITPTTRGLCGIMRPQLKILVHDKSTEYNVLTMPI